MSNWQPTMELRFVERIYQHPTDDMACIEKKILQQKWVLEESNYPESRSYAVHEEWRDVPVVNEDDK